MQRGFTLIELLIIISIVGIISSMVVINMTVLKQKSIESVIWHNIKLADEYAQICMLEGQNLVCSGSICDGHRAPIETDNICDFSPTWPELTNLPNTVWHMAWSNASTNEYCFELVTDPDPRMTDVYTFYGCKRTEAETGCFAKYRPQSKCAYQVPCADVDKGCVVDDDCCGVLECMGGLCKFQSPITS